MENESVVPDEIPIMVMISTEKKTLGVVSIFDNVAAIKAIKVNRDALNTMPPDWKSGCGFYILVSDLHDSRFHAYVGKATQNNFYARLSSHRRDKDNWNYAFLFQRDTSSGLNSTQAAYVEGEIYSIIQKTDEINVINIQTAGDKTLADHEIFYMNQVVKSSLRIMDIFGYKLEKKAALKEPQGYRYYGVSIKQLLKSGMLTSGERLHSMVPKFPATATVGIKGIVYGGNDLSPSAAALAALTLEDETRTSSNGWTFWAVERNNVLVSLADIRDDYISQKKLYTESLITESGLDFDEAVKSNEKTKRVPAVDPERHVGSRVKVYELVDAGLLEEGMELLSLDPEHPAEALIEFNAINFNGNHYPSVDLAGKYAKRVNDPEAFAPNGWEFWGIKDQEGHIISFSEILDHYLAEG